MPRSHSITFMLPSLRMYSADSNTSLTVAAMPRLSITGFWQRPASFSSEKFCILRAPIWIMSAYRSTDSASFVSINSVITGNPVASRASASNFKPSTPNP